MRYHGCEVMPKIKFRGKTYNSEFEMPEDVRRAYQDYVLENEVRTKSLTDIVDMPDEVKAIYERARGKVEERPVSSQLARDLSRTEDLYRQSAPEGMKHLPSDESMYHPSDPVIDPGKATIEPEPILSRRLITSILLAILLAAIIFAAMEFLA
jgi:hypothetical protein